MIKQEGGVASRHLRKTDSTKCSSVLEMRAFWGTVKRFQINRVANKEQCNDDKCSSQFFSKAERVIYSACILIFIETDAVKAELFISSHPAAGRPQQQGAHLPEGSDWPAVELLGWAALGWPGGTGGDDGDGYGLHVFQTVVRRQRQVSGVIVMPGKLMQFWKK